MSYTDIKYKKAYNKIVLLFMPIGVAIQAVSILLCKEYSWQIALNLISIFSISVLFYVFKIWAAGDAKVAIVMSLLLSYDVYGKQKEIPALYLIGFTFTIAFIYILIESIFLFICEYKKKVRIFDKRLYSVSNL